jgi:hypothetical protein
VGAADQEADLKVNIEVQSKQATEGFKQAAQKAKGFSDQVKGVSGGILAASGLQKASAAVIDFGKKAVHAYMTSQQNAVKYTDAMKRIPGASDQTTAALMDQATALSKVTTYGKGAVKEGQAILAGFGLNAAQLQKLTPLMLDYAQKTGSDLPTAAKQLGRALMGSGRSLKNIGIDFKDTGSLTGNYDQLVRELDKSVGGLSKQMGSTAEGQMQIMKNQIKGLVVAFGKELFPIVEKVVEILAELTKWLQKNIDWLMPLAGVILAVASAWTIATVAAKLYMAISAAMKATSPLVWIIVGIAAVVAAVIALYNNWTWFHDAIDAIWQAMQVVWDATVGAIVAGAKWIVDAAQSIWKGIQWAFDKIKAIIAPFVDWFLLPWRTAFNILKALVQGDFDKVLSIIKGIPGKVISALAGMAQILLKPFKAGFDLIQGLFPSLWSWFSAVPGKIAGFLAGVVDAIVSPFRRAFDIVKGVVSGAIDWVKGQFDRIKGFATDAVNFAKGIYNTFARGWNAIQVTMPSIDTHIPGIGKVGGFTIGLPDLPIFAKGAYASGPTLGLFGEAGGEYVLPERRLAKLLAEAINSNGRAGNRSPAVVVEHAHFAQEVDVDAFMQRVAWSVRVSGV